MWLYICDYITVLRIPQSSIITGTSPSNCSVSYPGQSLGNSYPTAEMQVGVFYNSNRLGILVLSLVSIRFPVRLRNSFFFFCFSIITICFMVTASNISKYFKFPFLQAYGFFLDLSILFLSLFHFSPFHYESGTFFWVKFHSYNLAVCSYYFVSEFKIVLFFNFANHFMLSMYISWLIFSWDFIKF